VGLDGKPGNANEFFGHDVFGYTLNYFNGDYKPIDATNKWTTVTDRFEADKTGSDMLSYRYNLFNGNIGSMVTTIKDPAAPETPLPIGNAYVYDQLNRIRETRSFDNINLGTNEWGSGGGYSDKYFNSFTYDANGNILTQTRYDETGAQIEDLTYNYAKDGDGYTIQNRLYHVNETIGSGSFPDDIDDQGSFDANLTTINVDNNYGYDEIGELTKDSAEEIRHIYWRVDGKVSEVIRRPGSTKKNLKFDYDAMGNRVAKHVLDNSNVLEYSEYYVRDAQGNVMAVYRDSFDMFNAIASFKVKERDIYGSSRSGMDIKWVELLGASAPDTDTYIRTLGYKQYEKSNHLGNVLAVVTDKIIPYDDDLDTQTDRYMPELISSNDYYAFGMLLSGRHFSSDNYRYGFNGKEKEDEENVEGGSYDFGARICDSRLGRWLSRDPDFKRYPFSSPYSLEGNNPIYYIDPSGKTLIIAGSPEEIKRVQSELQKLTNDKVEILSDGTVKLTASNKNPGKDLKNGTQLLRDVVEHKFTTTIVVNDMLADGSNADPQIDENAKNGKGTNVTITLTKSNGWEQVNKNGKTVEQKKEEYIVLGSEIIHSLIAMDGNSTDAKASNTYTNVFGDQQAEVYNYEEFVVHLGKGLLLQTRGKRSGYISENDLKKEQGKPLRVAYEGAINYMYKPENKAKLEKYNKEQTNTKTK
jgi:RHS repeat-associated protein